ncbi:hypothetical protein DUNSADRAFT_12415 [Dunaliella salina]|uniref:Uncharacterized protein n=1 Tax=Dunaliella salina TaxID=3046 RepID=A0ABQ7GBB8_DUNSA|nr:hypothetical protein DUNSADRAFT_12415 [Dunaliella salina]|eukprot:KAF5831878.1 hypothetical protein DUNSADRAFT_12415 [Dunaliella salina]
MTEPSSEQQQQQPKVDEQPKAAENAAGEQPAAGGEKEQQHAAAEQPASGEGKEQPSAEQPSEEVKEQPAEKKRKRDEPAHLGFMKFNNLDDLVNYFKHLLVVAPKNVDMNEYEHVVLLDLLKQHPEWDRKVGPGIKTFQVRDIEVPEGTARAFFAMRKDGSMEDFSFIKCAGQLYPGEVQGRAFSKGPGTGEGGRGGRGGNKGNRGGKGGRGGGGRRGGRR